MANLNLPPLTNVAHEQSDVLWDVIALLEGACKIPFKNEGESGDRLIRQAIKRIQSVQAASNSYI